MVIFICVDNLRNCTKTISKLLNTFDLTIDRKTTMFPDPKVDGRGIIFATVNPMLLNGHSQKHRELVFKTTYRLMQVKSIA